MCTDSYDRIAETRGGCQPRTDSAIAELEVLLGVFKRRTNYPANARLGSETGLCQSVFWPRLAISSVSAPRWMLRAPIDWSHCESWLAIRIGVCLATSPT